MDRVCKDCGGVFVRKNGTDREVEYWCDNCFLTWLEGFIKEVEAEGTHEKHLPFLKKLLTKKYIQRQEDDNKEDARIMRTRGGGYV